MVVRKTEFGKKLRYFFWLLSLLAAVGNARAATPEEQTLFQLTNEARAEHGLAALRWDDSLADAARGHLALMAQSSQLAHEYSGEPNLAVRAAQAGSHFAAVAENIAVGPSVESVQNGWMKSPHHRANILDPALNAVGFAVVRRGGTLYAVADFANAVDALSTEQVEAQVARLLQFYGVQSSGPRLDAEQSCEMSHGASGDSNPRFVMRWQNSNLSRLPPALVAELRANVYHQAAVGACSSANAETGFTTYRVAVLLY